MSLYDLSKNVLIEKIIPYIQSEKDDEIEELNETIDILLNRINEAKKLYMFNYIECAFCEKESIYDPNGGYFSEGTYVPSLAADIGRTIEKHLEHIGVIKTQEAIMEKAKINSNDELLKDAMICPMCNEKALIFREGCMSCLSCNYSKCS